MTDNPAAWAVLLADGERIYDVYDFEEEAKAIDEAVTGNHGVVPLYRQPKPTLTAEEREAIALFASFNWTSIRCSAVEKHAATLRNLLARLA
jgi:hypothetical protein